ncbi:hypothetical protein COO60DRAFT_317922 [Scenedesmus sp. NREL 46B-D3]|nr:hypothetical protein COO60DRAFT_317922 [Scenedesmus sp. NREL 46B-D3]
MQLHHCCLISVCLLFLCVRVRVHVCVRVCVCMACVARVQHCMLPACCEWHVRIMRLLWVCVGRAGSGAWLLGWTAAVAPNAANCNYFANTFLHTCCSDLVQICLASAAHLAAFRRLTSAPF